jgi:hypothetical protein
MSETRTIVIADTKKIAEGSGKKGPWKLFAVKDSSGCEYKTFDLDIGTANPGDTFTVDVNEKEYKGKVDFDIKPVKGSAKTKAQPAQQQQHEEDPFASVPSAPSKPAPTKSSGGGGSSWGESPEKSKQIRRAALMHDASAIVAAVAEGYWPDLNENTIDDMASFMLQLADKLEKWVGA